MNTALQRGSSDTDYWTLPCTRSCFKLLSLISNTSMAVIQPNDSLHGFPGPISFRNASDLPGCSWKKDRQDMSLQPAPPKKKTEEFRGQMLSGLTNDTRSMDSYVSTYIMCCLFMLFYHPLSSLPRSRASSGLPPSGPPWAPRCESSTPFVAMRWYLDKAGMKTGHLAQTERRRLCLRPREGRVSR